MQQGSEAIERERQLKQSERLYLNLRQVLSKQPGPEIQAELSKTQKALKSKGDKLKVGYFINKLVPGCLRFMSVRIVLYYHLFALNFIINNVAHAKLKYGASFKI